MDMRHFFISILLFTFALAARAATPPQAVWSTSVAVPGEEVKLYIFCDAPDPGVDASARLNIPRVPEANTSEGIATIVEDKTDPARKNYQVYTVNVTPSIPGVINMGEVEIVYRRDGSREKVAVPPLPVHSTADIQWYSKPFTYGVLWHYNAKEGYVNETVEASFKLFLPLKDGWKWEMRYAPSFHSVSVVQGEFHPVPDGAALSANDIYVRTPIAYANRTHWRTLTYGGTFTPTRAGKNDVTGKVTVIERQGNETSVENGLVLPTLHISVLPLPPGAPKDYANLTGVFHISLQTDAQSLAMNEPVKVEITVTGNGDMSRLQCPKAETPENWKFEAPSRREIKDHSNQTVGVVFTQLMRPTTEVGGIPAFTLAYFDPKKAEYTRTETTPVALPWRKTDEAGLMVQGPRNATPPPAGIVPVAEMTDIYSTYKPVESNVIGSIPRGIPYLLYLPAAGILLWLAGTAIRRRVAAGAAGRATEKELSNISHQESGLAFLKGIGAFIESRIPASGITPDLQDILDKRDNLAFRPDAGKADVGPAERQSMVKAVRQALSKLKQTAILLAVCCFFLASAQAQDDMDEAARADYEAAQYSACLERLQGMIDASDTPAAELWFNAGNCHYRLNHPGQAALCYARALYAKPWMREAEANLAFIQRKEGAVMPVHNTTDEIFTFLSAGDVWLLTVLSTAGFSLCIALHMAWRGQKRPWLHACTAFSALVCILCALNQIYYSTREVPDMTSLPPEDSAYITTTTQARTAAGDDASPVIQLPASTPVHLLAQRGSWTYVETFTGIRGWIHSSAVEPLLPGGKAPSAPVYLRFD